jgi:hypothetical protein
VGPKTATITIAITTFNIIITGITTKGITTKRITTKGIKSSGERRKEAGDLSTAFTGREECVQIAPENRGGRLTALLEGSSSALARAREVMNPTTISPSARAISLRIRIRNDSRTNGGCNFFEQAIEPAIGKASPFLMSRQ